jgi:drug/metabolite transporter (DMT)-like permease
VLPYLMAVAAAAFFALATALQHRAAAAGAPIGGGAKAASRAFGLLLTRPLWLAGLAADGAGFGLHAYALTAGELTIVQPLLVTGLLFALPLGAWLDHRRVTWVELRWATVSVFSLALFLVLARPSGGGRRPELGPAAAAAVVTLVLVVCVLLAGRGSPSRRAAALGAVTGLAFGATAALIKAIGGAFGHDPDTIFTSWPLYALLVLGPAGFVLNQVAFQAGPLSASLPAITAVDPLASIVLGVLLYDETLHGTPAAATGEAIGLLMLALSVFKLAGAENAGSPPPTAATADAAL